MVVSAGVFLIGFMLAGTMADYKESERILGEIVSALESIEETCVNLAEKINFSKKIVSQQRNFADRFFGNRLCLIKSVVMTGIMLIVRFKNLIATIIVVFSIALVYVYMYKLIKDIDDPFEYEANGRAGASKVALFPLQEHLERVKKRNTES